MNHKILKFKNGLTVIVCNCHHFNSIYFDLAIKIGSRYENRTNNGMAHLVEHILRKKAIDSLKKHSWIKHYINEEFQAYSMQDRTNFEFTAHKNDLKQSIKLLSTIIASRHINKKEIEIEKNIILEELLEYKNNPEFIFDRVFKTRYYKNHPLGFEILGTARNIKKFTQKNIKNFINEYYCPQNMILTIAGDINIERLKRLIIRNFKYSKSHKKIRRELKYIHGGDNLYIVNQKSQQNYFGFYCPIFNYDAVENVKWEFFIEILNNYLFYKITNKLHCYSISADIRTFDEFFNFSIESSFNSKKIVDFYLLLFQELKSFKKSLDKKEFNYFQNRKIINIDLNKDCPKEVANMMSWYGIMFGTEQILSLSDQQKIIKSITLKDIYYYFDQLFKGKRGTVIILGDMSKIKTKKIKKIWHDWKM